LYFGRRGSRGRTPEEPSAEIEGKNPREIGSNRRGALKDQELAQYGKEQQIVDRNSLLEKDVNLPYGA
jgi:hypothetical protein